MISIVVSSQERSILQRYFETSPLKLIRLKSQAVVMRSGGMKLVDIALALFRDVRTIERWLSDFAKRRLGSIFSGLIGNENASKMTKAQKQEISHVLQQKPSVYGLPKEFWDVPQLKQYIYARFGTVYESERSYHYLLEFGNLSFKYPDRFNVRRSDTQVAERMEQIYQEILPLMEDDRWEVFVSDEVRIVLEAITRKAWLKKGEKTVLKVERSKDYQNYLGLLNQKNFHCHVFEIAWGRAEEIIKAVEEFLTLYPDKKICIIWDNAKCHKGKLFQTALTKGGVLERVHLIALPPYAPDCNPIEHVWNTTKQTLSNHQDHTFDETKQQFMKLTNNQIFPYQI